MPQTSLKYKISEMFNSTQCSYPIFKADDNVEAWEYLLRQAVRDIRPAFFSQSQRFDKVKNYSLISLVDSVGIYEEGDWWALTVIQIRLLDDTVRHVFLPITGVIYSQAQTEKRNVAFGIETESEFYGIRNWKVIDAFTTPDFPLQLSKLFYKDEQICDYIEFHEGELGKFDFCLKNKFSNELWQIEPKVEYLESGEVQIKYANSYALVFPPFLTFVDPVNLESPNIIGYLAYSSSSDNSSLLIAILKEI